jgi:hypothetical protein
MAQTNKDGWIGASPAVFASTKQAVYTRTCNALTAVGQCVATQY